MTFWGSTTVIEKVYVTSAKATDKSAISSFVNGQRYMLLSPAVVEAARFMWERVLDMAYGSMELVKLDEIIPVLERIAVRLRNA